MKKPASAVASTPIIPIAEYRRLLNDQESTDEKIIERLQFLEALSRNIIRMELDKYLKEKGR